MSPPFPTWWSAMHQSARRPPFEYDAAAYWSRLGCKLALNHHMLRVGLTILFLLAGLTTGRAGDVDEGENIAVEHCRRCHVIPGENNMGIGISPSFKAMIQSKAEDWRHKFEIFYALRPHPSFVIIREFRTRPEFPLGIVPVIISVDDVDHLMAYVDKLAQDLRQ